MNGSPSPAPLVPVKPVHPRTPDGGFVELDGETAYRILNFQFLAPFLMSVPSDTDLWMFVTSGGGLTAGRQNADGSLFPYETVDRLHDAHHYTGPITIVRVEDPEGTASVWEPFSAAENENPAIERSLYKNATGNRLVFEEVHLGLGLAFRYRWAASDEFGWVRSAWLENRGSTQVQLEFLDGLRNVLPYGAPLEIYQQASTLVDAYKKTEVDEETGLGIFSLTSCITDRTEALEMLRANVVWCCGLESPRIHLSLDAVSAFRSGRVIPREQELNGGRGNYLVTSTLVLDPGATSRWHLAGDTGRDHLQISRLRHRLRDPRELEFAVDRSLRDATRNLQQNVGSADGMQISGRTASWVHHFANVLFNNMRGGVFLSNYTVPTDDLIAFLHTRNREVAGRHESALAELGATTDFPDLVRFARQSGDPDLERLAYEYLPLQFSRRHGDPSRPWNRFSIRTNGANGERELNFEGNWRDIFQNWEALAEAFPGFLPGMVAKFVNASTVDGFNPYRITREGVEWEELVADDPWSNIGYWGDHQIIYLLKLLEGLDRHDSGAIAEMLDREVFSYVEVPYRIKPYDEVFLDPAKTIDFDDALAARIAGRVAAMGSDGKLLTAEDGSVYRANLLEKLLVPVLSKLSNLVPDAGIWMNTQRPEWNDANNALGGGGVSVVTLCYLRRYLRFMLDRVIGECPPRLPVSREIAEWFEGLMAALDGSQDLLDETRCSPTERRELMDRLGGAFSEYRRAVYDHGFSGKVDLEIERVSGLFDSALRFIDRTIEANRRPDGLFHTYNQLETIDGERGVEVVHLAEMLEGQVAVLSSGYLEPTDALALLGRLFESRLYQDDRRSFLLYPDRVLPGFLEKNVVPEDRALEIGLLRDLLESAETSLLARDQDGVLRFGGDLSNGEDVDEALEVLAKNDRWAGPVARDGARVRDLFDEVFNHRSYTGRSGVMYGYEGLGCIYWHMVAKLLLAVQENFQRAEDESSPHPVRDGLSSMYFRVRAGIGYEKTAAEYGAFPTDPYSHTPSDGGARQPGMTGQVKEEILTRIGELGVRIRAGRIGFRPTLLGRDELLPQARHFDYFDVEGEPRRLDLPPGSLGFTLCQVPIVYEATSEPPWIEVSSAEGPPTRISGNELDADLSREIFARSGRVRSIRAGIPREEFARP